MPRAPKVCATAGCPNLTDQWRCKTCNTRARQRSDQARGTSQQRGYGSGHRRFRAAVLARDPICVLCGQRTSTVADHFPISRRDLEAAGLDPNDPARGRGLCATCDRPQTAARQPGGWNNR